MEGIIVNQMPSGVTGRRSYGKYQLDDIFPQFFAALVASGRATDWPGGNRTSLANLNHLDLLRDGSVSDGESPSARQPQTPDGHP